MNLQSSILDAICNVQDERIAVWNADSGTLIFSNQPFAEFLKQKKLSPQFTDVLNELLTQNAVSTDLLQRHLSEKGYWIQDISIQEPTGQHKLSKIRLSKFESGEQNMILLRIINIEELHSAIDIIRQEKQRFEALFEYASMAIIVANMQGDIVMANQFTKNLFGYTDSIFGLKVEDLIPQRFRQKHSGLRESYNHKPENRPMGQGMPLFAVDSKGNEFPVEVSLGHYAIHGERFVIAFIIDISKRRAIEKQLLEQNDLLEKNNREIEALNDELEIKVATRTSELEETLTKLEESKSELESALNKEKELSDLKTRFVSMASHEFRTPLSTILSSASLLAKYKLTEEQDKRDKHVQRIRSAVNNLTDILNEFLSIGRIEEGKIQASFSSFNIREHITLVCNEMTSILKQGQQFDYLHSGETLVQLDLSLLRNILINLISNAIKFSPNDAEIKIRSDVNGQKILISISDSGIGIPDEDQKHLFERFFRAHNVTNIQGTGLGLHIVSKYVELMNGKITFTSELEKGTTFKVYFNYE